MKTIDLTEGPPLGRMLRFCVPVVASNVFQMLYAAAARRLHDSAEAERGLRGCGLCNGVLVKCAP